MILGKPVSKKKTKKNKKTEGQKQVLRESAYNMNVPPANLICTIRGWKLARNPSHIQVMQVILYLTIILKQR